MTHLKDTVDSAIEENRSAVKIYLATAGVLLIFAVPLAIITQAWMALVITVLLIILFLTLALFSRNLQNKLQKAREEHWPNQQKSKSSSREKTETSSQSSEESPEP